ncbi:magnesium transporter CorA family protein [Thalassolituus sp. LLYu03]|uniref:magnesium transporter CorA family protein n=1 Tax=Thalassolituus sp. LLYu03 TaxID=3421656 RepID=UPI003D2CE3E6
MIRTLWLTSGGDIRYGSDELVAQWRNDSGSRLWVDICQESESRERELLLSLGCHPLAVSDALRDRHPPKLEEFSDFTFILYRGIASFDTELNHSGQSISFFVGERLLISRHPVPALSVDMMMNDGAAAQLQRGTAFLALRIMHASAGIYLDNILEFESQLSDLEDAVQEGGSDQHMRELISYRSRLVKLRRTFNYHKNITDELRSVDYNQFPDDDALNHVVIDLHDRFERLHSLTQMFYELCGDLINGYISVTSHQLNSTMRILTVITAIFVPLSFLAGVYGMNFDRMPELHAHNGYFILLGVMGSLAVGLLWWFRKMRWL